VDTENMTKKSRKTPAHKFWATLPIDGINL